MPSVVTFAPTNMNRTEGDRGLSYGDACRELERLGADVVGINCFRGPQSVLPVIKEVREKCQVRLKSFYFKMYAPCVNLWIPFCVQRKGNGINLLLIILGANCMSACAI